MIDEKALAGEMSQVATSWQRGLEFVRAMPVDSPEAFVKATELVRHAKAEYKRLEDKRTGITKPLLAAKAGVDDLFRAPLNALRSIESELKTKMSAWQKTVAQERERVMTESAAQHAAGLVPTALVPEPAVASGVLMREVWDFEITDPAAVPRRYCVPDPVLIREVIATAGDIVEIPGVRVFRKSVVTVRS